jgi:hypothetical protein
LEIECVCSFWLPGGCTIFPASAVYRRIILLQLVPDSLECYNRTMDSDLTFITNEGSKKLRDRFEVLIKDTKFFDVLVGYFYASGFYSIYKSLKDAEKIRILIGISTSREVYNLLQEAKSAKLDFGLSTSEVKEQLEEAIAAEMEVSEDNKDVEDGVKVFLDWLRSGKLEVRAYPTEKIHAKLYIIDLPPVIIPTLRS